MMDYTVFYALKEELDRAEKLQREATENFWRVSMHSHRSGRRAGGHHPDDDQAVNEALSRESCARKAHIEALVRLNEYLTNGTIPDHLKPVASATGTEQPRARAAGSA